MTKRDNALLDRFRLVAAVLVICNHTSPLSSYTSLGDFYLTRVLARLSVPFFLMVSGYFLAKDGWRGTDRFLKKTAITYLVAIVLYLPLNIYNGFFTIPQLLQRVFIEGTLYHLWYFPALILGVFLSRQLAKLGRVYALVAASCLYLIGLGGDSYYGLVSQLPFLKTVYNIIFHIFPHTRCGLFLSPLFILLGAYAKPKTSYTVSAFAVLSFAGMSAEGIWLHFMGWQRHDSMYLLLPVCMTFLFSIMLSLNRGQDMRARRMSMLMYIVHPLFIALLPPVARLTGTSEVLLENSLVNFLAVLLLTVTFSAVLYAARPIRTDNKYRAWREIDADALAQNISAIRNAIPNECEIMAVLKADAYGHGAVKIARLLRRSGVRQFAVACVQEGIRLRRALIRGEILILGYTPPNMAALLKRYKLTQTIIDAPYGSALDKAGYKIAVHIAIDTGMHRVGVPFDDIEALSSLYMRKNLKVTGTFSHLCVSDSLKPEAVEYTKNQLENFQESLSALRAKGIDPERTHIQASYGLWNLPQQPWSLVRIGMALFGVKSSSSSVANSIPPHPVMSVKARVTHVTDLQAGQSAGYGLAFHAERTSRIAVVSIGYSDGIPRNYGLRGGKVLIHGAACSVVGLVCMDQMLVDVTDIPETSPGDIVTIVGRDGNQKITFTDMAETCKTIANELLSRLGQRLSLVHK